MRRCERLRHVMMLPRLRALAGALAFVVAGAAQAASAQPVPRAQEPAAEAVHRVPDTMTQRMLACVVCHGKEGRATPQGFLPRIAGKPAGYLYNQLLNFRDGRRYNAAMSKLLAHLSDAYLLEIATYFASIELPYPPPQRPTAAPRQLERGETLALHGDRERDLPACVACHGTSLTGVRPSVPGLLGLPRDYLVAQLGAWRLGQRHAQAPDCMAKIAERMSPEDVSAVTTWLASRPVPGGGAPAAAPPGALPMECGGVAR